MILVFFEALLGGMSLLEYQLAQEIDVTVTWRSILLMDSHGIRRFDGMALERLYPPV